MNISVRPIFPGRAYRVSGEIDIVVIASDPCEAVLIALHILTTLHMKGARSVPAV